MVSQMRIEIAMNESFCDGNRLDDVFSLGMMTVDHV